MKTVYSINYCRFLPIYIFTHDIGLTALSFWFNKYPNLIQRFPRSFILEAAKTILENNTFIFNGDHYRQLMGTAMGTKFAPAYAALELGFLESTLYEKIDIKFSSFISNQFKMNYKRYLDDILIILDKKIMNVEEILIVVNNLDQLNFKYETGGLQVNFLDLKIYIDNSVIKTDIYYKNTDTKQYLQFKSCHPRHTKNAVPYNLARRICTIVSDGPEKEKRLSELFIYLKHCRYPNNVINTAIIKAKKIQRKALLDNIKASNNSTKILPYVSTYNPNYKNKFGTIKEVLESLII